MMYVVAVDYAVYAGRLRCARQISLARAVRSPSWVSIVSRLAVRASLLPWRACRRLPRLALSSLRHELQNAGDCISPNSTSVQFVHSYCAALTAIDSHECAVKSRPRRPNGTATFSVCVGIVRVSVLRHGTTAAVSSSLLAPTLQNCVVRRLTCYFAAQPNHCGLRDVGSYDQRHRRLGSSRHVTSRHVTSHHDTLSIGSGPCILAKRKNRDVSVQHAATHAAKAQTMTLARRRD